VAKRRSRSPVWQPRAGALAFYNGQHSLITQGKGVLVKVLAEACGNRWCVEALNSRGPVQITVKSDSLSQPQPGLFD
jgi:hypothetical protein